MQNEKPDSHPEQDFRRASEFHAVLLAMAGHDLRQPLHVIINTCSWLARRLTDAHEREHLRMAELAVGQLTDQLDRLVAALRLNERTAGVTIAPVPLAPLIRGITTDHADFARQKGVSLKCATLDSTVMSDVVLLDGILRNLLRNALKYTLAGGKVLLGCRRHGTEISIEIHDTGVGIPPDQLARVFEAFQRADSTGAHGLGLGLFVVRRAVKLLDHKLDFRSEPGRGTSVAVIAKAVIPDVHGRDDNEPISFAQPERSSIPLPNRTMSAAAPARGPASSDGAAPAKTLMLLDRFAVDRPQRAPSGLRLPSRG